jgi:hypothetical protein
VRSTPSRGSLTPDYRSVGHLRFNLRGILSLDIVCRSGFGWDCSLARCLLLLSWTTFWTVGMPRSEWIIALVIYHGAFTIAVSSLDWNPWMIAMLDLDAQPHSSRPAVSSRSSNSTKHCPNWANWGALRQVFRDLTSMEERLKEWRKSRGNPTSKNVYSPENTEAVLGARNLLQYRQLANKISRDISTNIGNFSRYY